MTDRSSFTLTNATFGGIPISDVHIMMFSTVASRALGLELWTGLGGEDLEVILPVAADLIGITLHGEVRGHATIEMVNGDRTTPLRFSGRGQLSGIPQETEILQTVGG